MANWQSGFVLASILQGLTLACLLWRAQERPANRYLALALLVLAGMLAVYPLGWHGRNEVPVWLAFLPCNLPLALGPLLYAYTRRTAQTERPRNAWLHGIAPVLQLLYLCTLSALPGNLACAWKEGVHDDFIKPLIELAVLISLAGYALASIALLRAFHARLIASRSDADLHDARWLFRMLATLATAFTILSVARVYTSFVAEIDASSYLMWLAIWSAWLGIEGWRVSAIPVPDLGTDSSFSEPVRQERDWRTLGAEWQARTRDGGWWREPDLTLGELARRIGTNTLYLSRAINEGLGMNFNEMINRLRSEEVARMIDAAPAAANDLLPAALDAGFSSKATFNRAFRANFGINPSEYRRRLIS